MRDSESLHTDDILERDAVERRDLAPSSGKGRNYIPVVGADRLVHELYSVKGGQRHGIALPSTTSKPEARCQIPRC